MIQRRTTSGGEVRYDVQLRRPDRTKYRRTFRTKKAAEAWERDELAKRDRGEWVDPTAGRVTVHQVAAEWLDRPGRRPKTVHTYRQQLERWVLPELGQQRVASVTPADVQRVVDVMVEAHVAANTVRNTYAAARAMFSHAVRSGRLGRTPCRGIELPSAPAPAGRSLEPAEVQALADAMDARYRPLVWCAALLSLRIGELAGLQVRDLDLGAGTLAVVRVVGEAGGELHVGPPKSNAGARTLALPGPLVGMLEEHVAGLRPTAWVFPNATGLGPIRYSNWRARVWNPAVRAAGLEGVTPHDLRRTAATLMVAGGVDPRTAQHRLGHADLRMTLGVYARVRDEADRDAADRLGRLWWPHPGPIAQEPDTGVQSA